jgi:hypothetical protein
MLETHGIRYNTGSWEKYGVEVWMQGGKEERKEGHDEKRSIKDDMEDLCKSIFQTVLVQM